jgi:hypothetical protein
MNISNPLVKVADRITALEAGVPAVDVNAIAAIVKGGLAKADVGLSNVDNTSDVDKPVSTAQAAALAEKLSTSTALATVLLQTFTPTGTDAVPRTLQSKIEETVSVLDFGANRTGGVSASVQIQKAINHVNSLGGGTVWVPKGTYLLTSTLTLYPKVRLMGAALLGTIFQRNSAYGDTITQTGGHCWVEGIYMVHGTAYASGDTSLNFRLTDGSAHIRTIDCQRTTIANNVMFRMPYGIVSDGCHNPNIKGNWVAGTWDPTVTNLQEGIASIWMKGTNRHGQLGNILDNYLSGWAGPSRSTTFTDGTNSVVASITANIGSQYGVLINSIESLEFSGNYIGRYSKQLYRVEGVDANAVLIGHRVTNNFFDNCGNGNLDCSQIYVLDSFGGSYSLGMTISNNTFNGQNDALRAIWVDQSTTTSGSAYGLAIKGNNFLAHVAAPLYFRGGVGVSISGNTITNYNSRGVTPSGGNVSFCAAIVASASGALIHVDANIIGGGGNNFQPSTSNNCWYGIWDATASGLAITIGTNRDAGVLTGFSNQPISLVGNGSPEGVVGAVVGSTFRRKNGTVGNQNYHKVSGGAAPGWSEITDLVLSATAAQLADKTHAINTTDKRPGKRVWESTNNREVMTRGTTDVSPWYSVGGGVTITPV